MIRVNTISDERPRTHQPTTKIRFDMKKEFTGIKAGEPNYPMITLLRELAEKYGVSYQQAYDVCV